jgi:hypothetical protein
MNPCVVTFDQGEAWAKVDRLKATCHKWGWNIHIVTGKWKGWGHRLKRVLGEADTLRRIGHTHLIAVDAYDVVAVNSLNGLEKALESYAFPALLMAGEAGCWPDAGRMKDYPPRQTHWWYAHSQYILDLAQPLPDKFGQLNDGDDDQRHITNILLDGTNGVAIDTQCRVFQSIAHCNPWQQFFEVTGDRIYNRHTKTWPMFAHGNGGTDMTWVPK